MKVHKFDQATCGEHDTHAWWNDWYRTVLPDYERHTVVTDLEWQRRGVDHLVHLHGGSQLAVDVKCRCHMRWFPNDVLIERLSSLEGEVHGWAAKPARTDYIAMVWPQYHTGYWIPFQLLRSVYERHRDRWQKADQRDSAYVAAQNDGYKTISVAVPYDVFVEATAQGMRINFNFPKGEE